MNIISSCALQRYSIVKSINYINQIKHCATAHSVIPIHCHSRHSMSTHSRRITQLYIDNRALQQLPIDKETRNYIRDPVEHACFSLVKPTPIKNPRLVIHSISALQLIDLSVTCYTIDEIVKYLSGNDIIPGSQPAAHCYCGHQFGYFSGQLGDGATMYLCEVINDKNDRIELQLKGGGLTPYSRTADGRKVLRSSLREFLCSEHMHALGIPTTRAGTCITSDSKVMRDVCSTP